MSGKFFDYLEDCHDSLFSLELNLIAIANLSVYQIITSNTSKVIVYTYGQVASSLKLTEISHVIYLAIQMNILQT